MRSSDQISLSLEHSLADLVGASRHSTWDAVITEIESDCARVRRCRIFRPAEPGRSCVNGRCSGKRQLCARGSSYLGSLGRCALGNQIIDVRDAPCG